MAKLNNISEKIFNQEQLKARLNVWRLLEKKIVFTNGCFDLIHLGHIDYLAKAADLGDKLIVGLNSDKSTSDIKGPNRPITDERSRAYILASMSFIDAVILFDEETPINLIRLVNPDVLVKGADYTIDQIVGSDIVIQNGGNVQTLEYLPGYSTTLIEKKIKSLQ
ncbi:D-glycero-beta-D-manno-heptose 1-phosphate adenylyltransferase [Daejeonella lutea]|uniref:D-glycero-beta-D-manno-heptose 1-phosphate adenylyltransferase n=1 Tax=Daejeonella lutea TaxID=572036 RepID=A0A1T5DFQ7_9SPHI|nr:D-glycero-beta-D-manno-heptose 1-phosphate adenylyltransferase [Daejeonella lutea]SKB70441.1 rfaE bifunctional protein, domain II [Daejeonella lutea]